MIARTSKQNEAIRSQVKITAVRGEEHYGEGYQDIAIRVPKIDNAKKYLGWKPTTELREGIGKTIGFYLRQKIDAYGVAPGV